MSWALFLIILVVAGRQRAASPTGWAEDADDRDTDRRHRRQSPAAPPGQLGRGGPQDTPASLWNYLLLLGHVPVRRSFPLYWMFVIATEHRRGLAEIPPKVVPGRRAS